MLISSSVGILYFRTRIDDLLERMLDINVEHFATTSLHPRYGHLKESSSNEINQCKKFILGERRSMIQTSRLGRCVSVHNSSPETYLINITTMKKMNSTDIFHCGLISTRSREIDYHFSENT
jgi:hypothetical protein